MYGGHFKSNAHDFFINTLNWVICWQGAKGDWDFQISDLVKNPDGTDI